MKRSALFLALGLCACNPNKTALDGNFHPTERNWGSLQPVWRDEFDDHGPPRDPETAKWVVAQYCGGSNNEEQCYTARQTNVVVDDGYLTITAHQEACSGDDFKTAVKNHEVGNVAGVGCPGPGAGPDRDAKPYSSARLHTKVFQPNGNPNAWRYGRIEIRAKLPYGTGTWAAFWMMPRSEKYGLWPQSGEIDILEAVNLHSPNQSGDQVQANLHFCSMSGYTPNIKDPQACDSLTNLADPTPDANNPLPPYQQVFSPRTLPLAPKAGCWPDLSNDFHTYAMEWSDFDLRFYLDDKLIQSSIVHAPDLKEVAPFREPFYLIINLAIGGDMAGTPQPTDQQNAWLDSTTAPKAKLVVDWVRVYECVPDPTAKNCIYRGNGLGSKPPDPGWEAICTTFPLPE